MACLRFSSRCTHSKSRLRTKTIYLRQREIWLLVLPLGRACSAQMIATMLILDTSQSRVNQATKNSLPTTSQTIAHPVERAKTWKWKNTRRSIRRKLTSEAACSMHPILASLKSARKDLVTKLSQWGLYIQFCLR